MGAVMLVLTLSRGVVAAANRTPDPADPCQPAWQGQRLSDALYDMDLMFTMLRKLTGHEDPKLKTLIEWNLQWSADVARDAIDHGAILASPKIAGTWLGSVQRVQEYVAAHPLAPPEPPLKGKLETNLKTIESWLEQHK